MASKLAIAALAMMVAVVLAAPSSASGLTCGQVESQLLPCMGYLKNGGVVPPACCNGVRSLNAAAATTVDRQTACNCLKQAASSVNVGFASSLPRKCNVLVPYPIGTSVDCSKVK